LYRTQLLPAERNILRFRLPLSREHKWACSYSKKLIRNFAGRMLLAGHQLDHAGVDKVLTKGCISFGALETVTTHDVW
jgi:hypothetical protein